MSNPRRRFDFLAIALFIEGGLIGVAALGGWLLEINPFSRLRWEPVAALQGLLAALGMFGLFLGSYGSPAPRLREIREFLRDTVGPLLAQCSWYDLVLVSALAGVGEELLFRGLLQPWLGLFWSNVVFALVHLITPMYALLAGLIGLFLGWLFNASDNLLAPIVTHGLYDLLAFVVVVRDYRAHKGDSDPD
jgi:uncharacterized protein